MISKETLQALRDYAKSVGKKGDKGITSEEIAEALGKGKAAAYCLMKVLMKEGRLRRCGSRTGESISGRSIQTPVYELIK